MVAAGTGLPTIAQTLNAEGLRSPRARAGRHHSWVPSSIRTALFNRLYKGDVVWGRTKKRDAWGRRKESNRPKDEWVVTTVEHLRIVSDELWTSAHEALQRGARPGTARSGAARRGCRGAIDTLKAELARREGELTRYADAIADAGPLATILQAAKVREQRRDAIRAELPAEEGNWAHSRREKGETDG